MNRVLGYRQYIICRSKGDIRIPKANDENRRGLHQTAYQIIVANNLKKLSSDIGDLWDSGKVMSDQCVHVVYDGDALAPGIDCWWKVRVWDSKGKVSDWSVPAKWSKKGFLGGIAGISRAKEEPDYVEFKVGSGIYRFRVMHRN